MGVTVAACFRWLAAGLQAVDERALRRLTLDATVEFLTFRAAQTSIFFLIVLALFLDVTVGYFISLRVARRDLAIEQIPV